MRPENRHLKTASVALAMVLVSVLPAVAHTEGMGAGGFVTGFAHPFSGIDHLTAIMGVGALAALRGGGATLAIPAAFITAMILGAILPIIGFAIPGAEIMIILSLLVVGSLLGLGNRLELPAVVTVVATFAMFHGVAHGNEMAISVTPAVYILGFAVATTLLLILGTMATVLTIRLRRGATSEFA